MCRKNKNQQNKTQLSAGADFEQCAVCDEALEADGVGDSTPMQSSSCSHMLHRGCWRGSQCPVCSAPVQNLHPVNRSELQVLQAMNVPDNDDVRYRLDDEGGFNDEGGYNDAMERMHNGPLNQLEPMGRGRLTALLITRLSPMQPNARKSTSKPNLKSKRKQSKSRTKHRKSKSQKASLRKRASSRNKASSRARSTFRR
jgi:hypothetical protein